MACQRGLLSVSHPTIAAKELQLAGFVPCRRRAFEICVGLHDLELPAPLLIAIVQIDCEPFSLPLPYHLFWRSQARPRTRPRPRS
jgi:hypothetical protein